MKEKAKKGKKPKVALKDLDVGKVKGGVAEEDPKGGIIDDNRPAPGGRSPLLPMDKFRGGFSKH